MVALVNAVVYTDGARCHNYTEAAALANGASVKYWGGAPKCIPHELDEDCPLLYVMLAPGGCSMSSTTGLFAQRLLKAHGVNTSSMEWCAQELYKKEKNALLAHGDSFARSVERLAFGLAKIKRSALWIKMPPALFPMFAPTVPAGRMRVFVMYRANALDSIVCLIRDFGNSCHKSACTGKFESAGIRVSSNGTASDTSRRFSSSGAVERIMAKLDAKRLNKQLKAIEKKNIRLAIKPHSSNKFPAMAVSYTRLANNMTATAVPSELLLGFETKPRSIDRLDESVAAWSAVLSSMGVAPHRAKILGVLADAWGTRPLTPHRNIIFNAAELKRDVEAFHPEAAARINRFWRA